MDKEIESLIYEATDLRKFRKVRDNGLFLSDLQINILERNNIPWQNYTNYKRLLFAIEETLEEIEDEELDRLSYELQEQVYYYNTNK